MHMLPEAFPEFHPEPRCFYTGRDMIHTLFDADWVSRIIDP